MPRTAVRVTNETYNWVSDARWHPSGTKIIATKWYFSKRSLGAGEGWEYEVPVLHDPRQRRVEVNSGKRLVSRVLPLGWTKAGYSEQQIGHEQFSWLGNDTLVYSGNTKDVGGNFEYSKGIIYACVFVVFIYINVRCGRRSPGYLFDLRTKLDLWGRRGSR